VRGTKEEGNGSPKERSISALEEKGRDDAHSRQEEKGNPCPIAEGFVLYLKGREKRTIPFKRRGGEPMGGVGGGKKEILSC